MKNYLRNLLVAATARLHVPHWAVYICLALTSFGSAVFGIDKATLSGVVGIAYLLLAVGR